MYYKFHKRRETCFDDSKIEFDDDYDWDGKWLWWMDNEGRVEKSRLKQDGLDHFYPSPEHISVEIEDIVGFFEEIL